MKVSSAKAKELILKGEMDQGVEVEGWLDLSFCTGLTSLPQGLIFYGHLDLEGCTALNSLGKGLRVDGDLDLSDCTGLTSLPEDLIVGGYLDLSGCTGLNSLPEGLIVNGDIYLSPCCTALQSLSIRFNDSERFEVFHDDRIIGILNMEYSGTKLSIKQKEEK